MTEPIIVLVTGSRSGSTPSLLFFLCRLAAALYQQTTSPLPSLHMRQLAQPLAAAPKFPSFLGSFADFLVSRRHRTSHSLTHSPMHLLPTLTLRRSHPCLVLSCRAALSCDHVFLSR